MLAICTGLRRLRKSNGREGLMLQCEELAGHSQNG